MPFRFGAQGGGGGGGVLGLGPAQNTFGDSTTADRAAAETLRNTYATANAAWLTQYNDNLSFWIRLVWNGGVIEQRRNAGGTAWEDVSNVIRGQTGNTGPRGEFRAVIYRNSATALATAPTGGSYVVASDTLTAPTDWVLSPAAPAAGETQYESYATIDPAAGGTITPTWSAPIPQGQGNQGAFRIQVFQNAAANPGTPTGGTYNVDTTVLTPPTGWAITATAPGTGLETFVSEAFINPETQQGAVTPTWNYPYEHGAASQLFTIVDVTGVGPPAPSASTIPHLYLDTEIPRAWLTQVERNYTNNPAGTFATFTRAGYIGDYRTLPPNSAVNAVGDIWYRHGSTHAWYRVTQITPTVRSNVVATSTALGTTTTWLGDQPDQQAALDRIANFDNTRTYVFFNEASGNVEQLDNASYMAQAVTLSHVYTSIELENDVYDSVKQVLVEGTNVSIDLDEDAGTITINATGALPTGAQIVTALDAELGSATWQQGGDGVVSGFTLDNDGNVSIARTQGNPVTADISDNLRAFLGSRFQYGNPIVYDEANDGFTMAVARFVIEGDQVVFNTPANLGTAAGNLTVSVAAGSDIVSHPLVDPLFRNVQASDLLPNHFYQITLIGGRWVIVEPLEHPSVSRGNSPTYDTTNHILQVTVRHDIDDANVIIFTMPAGVTGTTAVRFRVSDGTTQGTLLPLQDRDGNAVNGEDLTAARDYHVYRNGSTSYRMLSTDDSSLTGPQIVTLLAALTGTDRLNASSVQAIADAIDTELGSTTWRTGGGGTADGVVNSIDFGANGTLTLGRTLGGNVSEDISANLKAFIGLRSQIAGATTYTEANDQITAVVLFEERVGDVIYFVAPNNVAQAAGDLQFATILAGITGTFYPLHDRAGDAVTASDLRAGTMYSINRFASSYRILESLSDSMHTPPVQHPSLYFGTSTDSTPTAAELTIEGSMGMGTIPAYSGSMHQLIARLDSEGDITTVTYSDDPSNTNQIGAFAKFGSTVEVGGEDYAVWVSNQALTQSADLTITVA